MKLTNFIRNEDGALTIDWTVLVAGLVGVGLVITSEIAFGVENVTAEYDGINTGTGMMTMFVDNPQETVVVAQAEICDANNPGNDKCVGAAGETPNGDESAWGDGSTGQGDVASATTPADQARDDEPFKRDDRYDRRGRRR